MRKKQRDQLREERQTKVIEKPFECEGKERGSVTRLGIFKKFQETHYPRKVAQIFEDILGYFKKHLFKVKTVVATFCEKVGKFWATFYSNIWSRCLAKNDKT